MRTYLFPALLFLLAVWLIPGLGIGWISKGMLTVYIVMMAFLFIMASKGIVRRKELSQSRFNAGFFGNMFLRMLLAIISISIFLIFNKPIQWPSLIFMICIYFVFMSFEIRFILPKLRTDSEKSGNSDDARK